MKILCYHGVTKDKTQGIQNYNNKHLNKKIFLNQVKKLKNNYNIVKLSEIYSKAPSNKEKIAITFDDGFLNNYTEVFPIIKKYKIPVTFFICPGNISNRRYFWVDEIEHCINFCKKKEIKIKLDKEFKFNLEKINKKIIACESIKKFCKNSSDIKRKNLIKSLKKKCGFKFKNINIYKTMTWSNIFEMCKNDLIDFGIHSYKHEILSKLQGDELNTNIKKSIQILQKKINKKIFLASYPEGKKNHFNKKVVKVLKKFNIMICPTSISGNNNLKTDPFNLKRYMIGFKNVQFKF